VRKKKKGAEEKKKKGCSVMVEITQEAYSFIVHNLLFFFFRIEPFLMGCRM